MTVAVEIARVCPAELCTTASTIPVRDIPCVLVTTTATVWYWLPRKKYVGAGKVNAFVLVTCVTVIVAVVDDDSPARVAAWTLSDQVPGLRPETETE